MTDTKKLALTKWRIKTKKATHYFELRKKAKTRSGFAPVDFDVKFNLRRTTQSTPLIYQLEVQVKKLTSNTIGATKPQLRDQCYEINVSNVKLHYFSEYGISTNPCNYQTYAGSQPFSEIETRTFSEYISNLDNILAYIAFHSDAQMLLVPYSDSVEHTGNYDDLVSNNFITKSCKDGFKARDFSHQSTSVRQRKKILYFYILLTN